MRCPPVLRQFQARYRYFCVDEAQDTSKIQHAIISLLAKNSGNLFMVGDEDQSIYGFRAAYPQALLHFQESYPRAQVLYMETNYRSTQEIVSAAQGFIEKNPNRHPKHMVSTGRTGPRIRKAMVQNRASQYAYLAAVVKKAAQPIAILYRDNDSAIPLIDLFQRQQIPYRCRQVDCGFFTHRAVRDICNIIRFATQPCNGALFLDLYYKLGAGITRLAAVEAVSRCTGEGSTILEYLSQCTMLSPWSRKQCAALQAHFSHLLNQPAHRAIHRIVHYMGYGDYLESKEMDAGKIPILEAIGAREPTPQGLLRRLEELSAIVQTGSGQAEESRFILSTIHSSKGLEYDRVFLMDVADGIFPACLPSAGGGEAEAYAEERRLFYVGMTRAKQELAVFRFQSPALHSTFAEELFPTAKPVKAKAPENRNIPGVSIVSHRRTPVPGEEWSAGGLVEHRLFGRGKIVSRQGDIVSIRFANGKVRYFALNFAVESRQLKRVNPNE